MIVVVGRLQARIPAGPGAATLAGGSDPRVSGSVAPAGLAPAIAAAAASGSAVELIAKLGDDRLGDATLFALSRAGIRHNAILRDATRPTPVTMGGPGAGDARAAGDEGADADDEWARAIDAEADDAEAGVARPDLAGLPLEGGDVELALRYLTDVAVVILADPEPAVLLAAAVEGAAFHGAALILLGDPETLLAAGAPEDATILGTPAVDSEGRFAALVAEYAVALDGGKSPAEAWEAATRRLGAERA